MNILTAAETMIIPIDCEAYSIQGLAQFMGFIENIREYCNPELTITGILLTRYKAGEIVSKQVREAMESVAEKLHTKLFDTTIREAAAIRKTQLFQSDLFEAFPAEGVAVDYMNFINEVLDRTEGKG